MGSGTTRKRNDSVIINRPKTQKSSGTGGGGRNQTHYDDMNVVCPPTFKVKLTPQKPLLEGAHLHIEKRGIFHASQKVGSLTEAQSATVFRCATEGFRYSGEVVNKGNSQYGVFTRK